MRTFNFETSLWLPEPPERVFPFFSDVGNLETITPDWLRFEIMTRMPVEMAVGTAIDYRLCYRGVPLKWQSEILEWDPPNRFIDSQVAGPYRKWVHEHSFQEHDGGTLATDSIEYAVLGGALANKLMVRRDLERIFSYRKEKLIEVFGGLLQAIGLRG